MSSFAMEKLLNSCLFVILFLNLVFGFQVYAVPYDYSFTHECLATPLRPQYGGGIVVNPELNDGLNGWTTFGHANVEHGKSYDDNKYIVASQRNQPFHSFAQKFNLEKEKLYTFSAWLQVSHGNADIAAVFKTNTSYKTAGWVTAQKGCWSMLKGGLVVDTSGPAELYFESNNTVVDIWADSISLQPFTHEEWKSHQDQSIEKFRKTRVRFQAVDQNGQPIPNATVSITNGRPNFPFGAAISKYIIGNSAYQNWFASRFKYTVFENELKWLNNEPSRGYENYSNPDAMLKFAKYHGISVRGHNIFWADRQFQPNWVGGLSTNDLWAAVNKRVYSIVNRYKGRLIHWDVENENLHSNFFQTRLGYNVSAFFFEKAHQYDWKMTPFLNEYNTIEESSDVAASPHKYLQRIWQIRNQGYKGPLGIGLQGHFSTPSLPYIRSGIDSLGSTKLPIWITELDVKGAPNQQATYLNQLLRELHSHWAVKGIIMWTAWSPQGCFTMCLTDNNFKNLATGNVVDKIRYEWTHGADLPGTTNSNGFFEASLFHGDYDVKITHPKGDKFSSLKEIKVVHKEKAQDLDMHRFTIHI